MIRKIISRQIIPILMVALVFLIVSCESKEKDATKTKVVSEDKQLYTCGMHPNVIQEDPGNCPICGMTLVPLGASVSTASTTFEASKNTGEKKILYWRAPMDPTYISPKPGKSPMGMDLIPVYAGEEAFGSTVKINPVVEQNIGVRVAPVSRKNLYQKIRTIGRLDYDESKVARIHTKFSGWIEKTYVNTTGEPVIKGQALLDIYSPQLVTAQEEYIDVLNNLRNLNEKYSGVARLNLENMLASTKRRLEYFDISKEQIDQLANTGVVKKTLTITSPFSGIVVEKHALDGMEVKPGTRLYTITDLSEIWVYADVYEYEVPWVREGQKAIMTLSYEPGKKYEGKVQYIYPYLEEKTRTVKVRLSFSNPNLDLKPGMYANVEIESSPVKDVIAVPMEAVLFSGERNLVFVSLGEGRFAPRDVTLGIESGDGYYEIREGLVEGETVVTSGQFLLDSESRLQESIAKMLGSRKGMTSISEENIVDQDVHKNENDNHEMNMSMPKTDRKRSGHNGSVKMHNSKMEADSIGFGQIKDGVLTYYTCPMEAHSFVKMKEFGRCPECGMNLVEKQELFDAAKTYYTCPMPEHSYVITDEPGSCPVCNMTLVEIPSGRAKNP